MSPDYNDNVNGNAIGWVRIIDDLGNVITESNQIHFGNITGAIAQSLAGDDAGHIRYMAFGNGGSSITASGTVFYRSPNVSEIRDPGADLYNQTYQKEVFQGQADNNVEWVLSNSNYADCVINVKLDFGEPTGQDANDQAEDLDDTFIFDEIGIKSSEGSLLTHVIFSPVQKSLNRAHRVEYTIRIQMG